MTPDSRKKGSMTKQQRTLRRFSQLWLSANEWDPPVAFIDDKDGGAPLVVLKTEGKVVAWLVNRKRPL